MSGPRVFVSYDRSDRGRFVDPFVRQLGEHGVRVWVDHGQIRPGDSLVRRIFAEGIGTADTVVAVVSAASLANSWCAAEWDSAVARWIRGRCRIMVVRLDGVDVPPPLDGLAWVDVDPAADWSDQFGQVLRSVLGPAGHR